MPHHEQRARSQPSDEEPRTRNHLALEVAGASAPRPSSIRRNALPDAVRGPHEHPQAAVPPFDNHVLVDPRWRHAGLPNPLESLPLIARTNDIRSAFVA